jgi:hypothetical protein
MERSPPSPTPPALRAPPPHLRCSCSGPTALMLRPYGPSHPTPRGEGSHGDIRWKAASGGGADAGFPKDQEESARENPFLTGSPPGSPRAVDRGGCAPSHLWCSNSVPKGTSFFGARTPPAPPGARVVYRHWGNDCPQDRSSRNPKGFAVGLTGSAMGGTPGARPPSGGEGARPLPCLCLVSSASRLNTYRLPYACNPSLRRRVPVHSSSKPLLPEGGSTWGY